MTDPVATARSLAPVLAGRAAEHDREASLPKADLDDLRAAGLLGLMVPEHLGGLGAGFATYAAVAEELGRGSGATALIYNMHACVTGALATTPEELARALGATDAFFVHRDRVLRAAADGALYAVAMSERGAGSRFSAMTTEYRPEGDGWRVRGSKTFVSGAGAADAYLVVARRAGADPAVVSQFLVPAGAGVVVEQTWDPLGMRATASNDVHLDAHVDADALLGGVEGLALLLARVMPHWLVASYAAVYVGVARACVDAAADHLRARSLTDLGAVRARLGRADAAVEAVSAVVREAARRVDAEPGSPETNRWVYRAKLLAGETVQSVAASLLEACGTSATRRGSPLERLYRDARCGSLQPATSDVCADWLGTAALGLDPDNAAAVPRW
jgi:alkylation response protein AidB-like acyl-CoA dehydrogenase